MLERRKSKRIELQSKLIMKPLNGTGEAKDVQIDIVDVSKTGIGFTAGEALQIGTVYEAYLTIWTKEVLHAFLEIVRIEKMEDHFSYGATFVGMPELDASRISNYGTIEELNSLKK